MNLLFLHIIINKETQSRKEKRNLIWLTINFIYIILNFIIFQFLFISSFNIFLSLKNLFNLIDIKFIYIIFLSLHD